jgi:hydrogenase maturation protease
LNTFENNDSVPAGPSPPNRTAGGAGDAFPAVPKADHPRPKTLLLGLGNDILCDDAVGLKAAQQIRLQCDPAQVDVIECCEMGLSLLDHLVGYDRVLVVDAVQTCQAPPGFVHALESDDIKILPRMSPHFFGIGEALVLGRQLGMAMPSQVKIFAIEVADPFTVATAMTPAMEQALPAIVAQIMAALREMIRARQGNMPPRET